MIWLAWRQQRTEALVAALLLAVAVAVLIPVGLHVAGVYDRDGIGSCLRHPTGACDGAVGDFQQRFAHLTTLIGWLNLLPGIVGALFALPLVLELEQGTFRLAWTQSVTRDRWIAVKLATAGAGALVASVLFTVVLTWWRGPFDAVQGRFSDGFDVEGLVPVAYTLFATAVALAGGVVLRRAALALALALIAFVAVRVAVELVARPSYQPAIHRTWNGDAGPDLSRAWVISESSGLFGRSGRRPTPQAVGNCIQPTGKQVDDACLARRGIRRLSGATFQPAGRFWRFQLTEAALYGAATLLLTAFTVWWLRSRIS